MKTADRDIVQRPAVSSSFSTTKGINVIGCRVEYNSGWYKDLQKEPGINQKL